MFYCSLHSRSEVLKYSFWYGLRYSTLIIRNDHPTSFSTVGLIRCARAICCSYKISCSGISLFYDDGFADRMPPDCFGEFGDSTNIIHRKDRVNEQPNNTCKYILFEFDALMMYMQVQYIIDNPWKRLAIKSWHSGIARIMQREAHQVGSDRQLV